MELRCPLRCRLLSPVKKHSSHWTAGWLNPRTGMDAEQKKKKKISCSYRESKGSLKCGLFTVLTGVSQVYYSKCLTAHLRHDDKGSSWTIWDLEICIVYIRGVTKLPAIRSEPAVPMLHSRQVPSSYLGPNTGYSDSGFSLFPSVPATKYRDSISDIGTVYQI